ncbi:hypothetical protein [Chryseobacterium sp. EO14]|uniref:hypothetical protein n=1 Tax=Chryseobacterium sp. EO14 TaxID=2950551 RepID=UPI00210A54F6|nr:hypothetical protein [Chryseobacterium sp. EO14]MCQ4142439.1 hypothetical protein [Chryseobacterium sp. EO14]
MNQILNLCCIIFPLVFSAQLSVTTSTLPEFCTGDGNLTINLDGVTIGANYDFEIYKLSNTTNPYRVTNDITVSTASFVHTENNLPSGNYLLKTYEDVGGIITQKNNNFTISNNFTALNFTVSNVEACDGAKLITNVTSGSPYSYELRNPDGTIVISPQVSNILSQVLPGSYNVIVTDTCGNTKSLGVTVLSDYSVNSYSFKRNNGLYGFWDMENCNTIKHFEAIEYNNTATIPSYRFPINVTYTIQNPITGIPTVINDVWTSNAQNNKSVGGIPFYDTQTYDYTVSFTDACGITKTQTNVINAKPTLRSRALPANCGTKKISLDLFQFFSAPVEVKFTSYPVGFAPSNYNNNYPIGSYTHTFTSVPNSLEFGTSSTLGVPEGVYTIETTSCGRTLISNVVVANSETYRIYSNGMYPGCSNSEGSIRFHIALTSGQAIADILSSVSIISAPAEFVAKFGTLPYDASVNIASNGIFYMNSLPIGNYNVVAKGTCGIPINYNFTINSKNITSSVTPVINCGSFDVIASVSSNTVSEALWLQKYYPTSGKWGHPITGVLYTENSKISATNGMGIGTQQSNSTAYNTYTSSLSNITTNGTFRVVLQYEIFINGQDFNASNNNVITYCRDILETFTVNLGSLSLNDYYVFSCGGNKYDLVIDATGTTPINYTIIEKDGVALNLNNGTNSIFTDLSEGIYKVAISDICGNSNIFKVLVKGIKPPVIKMSNICEGENGKLYITGLSSLNITWTKGTDPTVLSTGSTLNFLPYNAATDQGVYYAHIESFTPASCINTTLSVNINLATSNNPNAGIGQAVTINANNIFAPINLFDYLSGYSDTNGEWSELTNPSSGLLAGNFWYSDTAISGTYIFQYKVNGACSGTDTAVVTITFKDTCTKPGDFSITGNPSKVGITTQNPNNNWPKNIPNGFITLESKNKGFVITRVDNIASIADPKEGMLAYDIYDACVKLYNGTVWKCISKSCNE